MIMNLFNPSFFHKRFYRGIIYFLMLVALAMTLIAPIIMLLPAVFMAVVSYIIGTPEYATGYIAVALSVCKNE